MSLADIINEKRNLDSYTEKTTTLTDYGKSLKNLVSLIAEYLISNIKSASSGNPEPNFPSIPYGYISTVEFEKKYGIATSNTLGYYCRNQELPFNAFTIDPNVSTDERCFWYVHPKRTFDYLLTKKLYQSRIRRGLYKSDLKELMD